MSESRPLLSVGVIFKNEIRCLERCFKSVENLKSKIPCELVVADTGSDDGSHEVAERYADILIDFPWINDFAAARNAVMERCSGYWCLTVDADEWLDDDVAELVKFMRSPKKWEDFRACGVNIRNYTRLDLQGDFSDFVAVRMVKMSTGIRYTGAVHEHYDQPIGNVNVMSKVILHHDGYVGFGGERGRAKRERNMELLREQLRNDPDNLLVRLQCLESSVGEAQIEYLRGAVEGVEEKLNNWENVGPPIYRYAAFIGYNNRLPEYEKWVARAWELFPKSMFTRIDIAYLQFQAHMNNKEYSEAIPFGKGYLKALKEYRAHKNCGSDLLFSSLSMITHSREEALLVSLLNALFLEKRFREARGLLTTVDFMALSIEDSLQCFTTLLNIHAQSDENMGQTLLELWSKLDALDDNGERRDTLTGAVRSIFTQQQLDAEDDGGVRHAYTAFLPLEGKCWPGDAAALMEKEKPAALDKILARQEDLSVLPATALVKAFERGAAFPLPGKPMKVEEMDRLASRLVSEKADIRPLAVQMAERDCMTMQELCWARSVVMAAVRTSPWDGAGDDFGLAQAFASIEGRFLRRCYAPGVMDEEDILVLPTMHRFGWYCVRAFDAMRAGDMPGYVRLLRQGLEASQEMRPMVAFLQKDAKRRLTEQRMREVPAELIQLAEQVKMVLSKYPSSDPAVAAIKGTPAYQKVAWLIEDPPMLAAGSLAQ